MGNWTIIIQGDGVHDEEDLDNKVKKFIKEEFQNQHIVTANVTADWRRNLI